MKILIACILLLLSCASCRTQNRKPIKITGNRSIALKALPVNAAFDTSTTTIHVMVALCDNQYQGIVPVPSRIGNGQDVNSNLYWGCAFGVRSYFNKSAKWKLVKKYSINDSILERLIFKSTCSNYYLVADAYNGKFIRQCSIDFFNSCSGAAKDTIQVAGTVIGIYGNASLLAYTGHDGLMDFSLDQQFENTDGKKRDAIILACISKKYFAKHIAQAKAIPLLWSTGLMSPEAYTLHDALDAYIRKAGTGAIRGAAARAYARYQHCSIKAAENLLVSGY